MFMVKITKLSSCHKQAINILTEMMICKWLTAWLSLASWVSLPFWIIQMWKNDVLMKPKWQEATGQLFTKCGGIAFDATKHKSSQW